MPLLEDTGTTRRRKTVHEPKSQRRTTPYWWEDAPINPLPQQPLAKSSTC